MNTPKDLLAAPSHRGSEKRPQAEPLRERVQDAPAEVAPDCAIWNDIVRALDLGCGAEKNGSSK